MRTSVTLALCALLLGLFVACRSAPTSEPTLSNMKAPPIPVRIDVDAKLRERLAVGIPMHVELRTAKPDTAVGACALGFDLWNEDYRVSLSKTDITHDKDPANALRVCVDMDKVQQAKQVAGPYFSPVLSVREVERPKPLYDANRDARVW
jgi:hypothetical protein